MALRGGGFGRRTGGPAAPNRSRARATSVPGRRRVGSGPAQSDRAPALRRRAAAGQITLGLSTHDQELLGMAQAAGWETPSVDAAGSAAMSTTGDSRQRSGRRPSRPPRRTTRHHHHRSRNDRAPLQKRWRPSPPARRCVYAAPGRRDGPKKLRGQRGGPRSRPGQRGGPRKQPRQQGSHRKPHGQRGIATAAPQTTRPPCQSSTTLPGQHWRHGSRGGPSWLPSSRSCCWASSRSLRFPALA